MGDLFDEEPPNNSPEDLGFGKPPPLETSPPEVRKPAPPADDLPRGLGHDSAKRFIDWVKAQDGVQVSRKVTFGHVVCNMGGFTDADLRWLCLAIKQAKKAPKPSIMAAAVKARDVSILRGDPADDDAERGPEV